MSQLIVIYVLGFLTLASLVFGIVLFAKGKSSNGKVSNKLMVARVVFQALTIAVLAIFVYLAKK